MKIHCSALFERKTGNTTSGLSILGPRLTELRRLIDAHDATNDYGHTMAALCREQDALVDSAMATRPNTVLEAGTLTACIMRQVERLHEFDLGNDRRTAEAQLVTAVANLLGRLHEVGLASSDSSPIAIADTVHRYSEY